MPSHPHSSINPDDYPPAELPTLTREEMEAISNSVKPGRTPAKEEVEGVHAERRRATHKIQWAASSGRPDSLDRILSANDTVATTFGLDGLAVQGRDFRQSQAKRAQRSRKRGPLNEAILKLLKTDWEMAPLDLWTMLPTYEDPSDADAKFFLEGGFLKWSWWDQGEEKHDATAYPAFQTRVSRLKRRRPR